METEMQVTEAAVQVPEARLDTGGWRGHPRGLTTLFFTEMWERFSYYGMRAFLILYMTASTTAGGLGFDVAHAGSVYGTYTGSIWAATIGGGLVADRLLGAYRSVLIGGIIIALGHFTLAFKSLPFFYSGLALIVLGTGLLKPTTTSGRGKAADDDRAVLGFTAAEWMRIGAVFVFFLFAVLFWGAYEQAASTLGLFADRHTAREMLGFTIPSSWFVSIQALFVILLSPVFAWLWVRLGPKEPSTPMKFAFGLLLAGVSFILLLPAGIMAGRDGVLVSPLWLVAAYFIQVMGELCLSPVGNSVVTKLAPARVVCLMMGVWFLSIAGGNKLAGWAAGLTATVPLPTLFGSVAAVTLGAALILILLNRPIRRLMGGVR